MDALREARNRCHTYDGQIAVGSSFWIRNTDSGKPVGYGSDEYNQCKVQKWKNIIALSAGYAHVLGLDKD